MSGYFSKHNLDGHLYAWYLEKFDLSHFASFFLFPFVCWQRKHKNRTLQNPGKTVHSRSFRKRKQVICSWVAFWGDDPFGVMLHSILTYNSDTTGEAFQIREHIQRCKIVNQKVD